MDLDTFKTEDPLTCLSDLSSEGFNDLNENPTASDLKNKVEPGKLLTLKSIYRKLNLRLP